MRFIKYLLLPLLILACVKCPAEAPAASSKIADYVFEKLPEYGTLKQDSHGFVYLDLDDDYIHGLAQFIKEEGFEEPPYFGRGWHGAHISVISAKEAEEYGIDAIEEDGTQIWFQVQDCQVVQPPSKRGQSYYVLTVKCPYLERLRKKYKLPSPKYGFHITIGVRQDAEAA